MTLICFWRLRLYLPPIELARFVVTDRSVSVKTSCQNVFQNPEESQKDERLEGADATLPDTPPR